MGRVEMVHPQLTAKSYWSTGLKMLEDWPNKQERPNLVEAQGHARDILDDILALGRLVDENRGSERSRAELAQLRALLENDTTRLLPMDSSASSGKQLSELHLLSWYSYLAASVATGLVGSGHTKRQQLLEATDPIRRLHLARAILSNGLTQHGSTSLLNHPQPAFK
eukprot:comp7173_c0_seq2/m.2892 comp7173_c0_seq2/g.2892  ORF comp7173_c0_seq2/g.2892 comp7173_c0_seq2/m.2892 type:complete len:167 (-) comp7173_c0_seq2:794-1294(-)